MARPRIDRATAKRTILAKRRSGLTLREACERAGVHIATACRWKIDDAALGEKLTSAAHHAAVER